MAIARCVVALDKLKPASSNYSFNPRGDFERVLKYLAARYGVQWPPVEYRCPGHPEMTVQP